MLQIRNQIFKIWFWFRIRPEVSFGSESGIGIWIRMLDLDQDKKLPKTNFGEKIFNQINLKHYNAASLPP